MLLLAGCLTETDQSNFADPANAPPAGGNSPPSISGNPPISLKVGESYSFTPIAIDPDGDSITFSIANQPGWINFDTATGQISGTPAAAGNFPNIQISVSDGQITSTLPAFTVNVTDDTATPTNSAPSISGTASTVVEVGAAYSFSPTASDADGDTLTFSIVNQPDWASFDTDSGQLSGAPAVGNIGNFPGIQISVSDGQANSSLPAFTINVSAVNARPTISGTPSTTVMVGEAYFFSPTATDPDGDTLNFSIENRPGWAIFDNSTGQLSGTPATGDISSFPNIRISVSDGHASATLPAFTIDVSDDNSTPTNSAPSISGTPSTTVKVSEAYIFTPIATDTDGDTLTFSITNRPGWASFDNATGQLSGTPAVGNTGSFSNIEISVSDGLARVSLAAFTIEVSANNAAPTISGTPSTTVEVGEAYAFTPTATDPDGDTLSFSITNRPAWANFNNTTGRLSGTPTVGSVGSFQNIQISVSDGQLSATLAAFAIDVSANNRAPSISGSPPTSVKVGEPYSFTPSATDPDGDTLSFSITNRPGWASFNSTTGQLSGTPAAGNIGNFANIRISVSDGQASASLPGFSIDVTQVAAQSTTVSWTAPTQNDDGTPLTDLTGYKIYYGTSSRNYSNEIPINNPGITTYVIDNLTPGTYFISATAVNSSDVESDYSGEAVVTLN
jgi:hypothetical protein